ncbi:MAG: glycosyltransferase family 4 protein [Cyclobacterium sp.]|uniref:glycosyltransferase family 4 protein n=1 Tax=Cyclobacterium sp. TaxID=1966343 RepID=UPI003970DAC6
MKKILFLTGILKHYRVPIFDIIGNNPEIDLTVAHAGKKIHKSKLSFKEVILEENFIGLFSYHNRDLIKFCQGFDVVVAMFYLQKLSFVSLAFLKKRNFKLIYWGIGVKASQRSSYDSPSIMNYFRYLLAKKADAMIFYTEYPIKKYIAKGIAKEKLFVMPNTVAVRDFDYDEDVKNRVIFVGTLNRSKKILELFNAYKQALEISPNLPKLDVVGDGEDLEKAKDWIKQNHLDGRIKLHGAIYDEVELEFFFKHALACISPGQAGLSVLKSMGYGVPFITRKDAITGGELFNIRNGFNGILFEKDEELKKILVSISIDPVKYKIMGRNAYSYYKEKRSPAIMANGFIEAVKYVSK